jgi:hypothetical protein
VPVDTLAFGVVVMWNTVSNNWAIEVPAAVVRYKFVNLEESAGAVTELENTQQGYMVGEFQSPPQGTPQEYRLYSMLDIETVCGKIAEGYRLALQVEGADRKLDLADGIESQTTKDY